MMCCGDVYIVFCVLCGWVVGLLYLCDVVVCVGGWWAVVVFWVCCCSKFVFEGLYHVSVWILYSLLYSDMFVSCGRVEGCCCHSICTCELRGWVEGCCCIKYLYFELRRTREGRGPVVVQSTCNFGSRGRVEGCCCYSTCTCELRGREGGRAVVVLSLCRRYCITYLSRYCAYPVLKRRRMSGIRVGSREGRGLLL